MRSIFTKKRKTGSSFGTDGGFGHHSVALKKADNLLSRIYRSSTKDTLVRIDDFIFVIVVAFIDITLTLMMKVGGGDVVIRFLRYLQFK